VASFAPGERHGSDNPAIEKRWRAILSDKLPSSPAFGLKSQATGRKAVAEPMDKDNDAHC
jgi:hypothetical protein